MSDDGSRDRKMSYEEVRSKVEWEGGITETITGYGLPVEVLPEDTPWEVRAAWQRIYEMHRDISIVEGWLYD